MPTAPANGITIEYETTGDPDDRPLLLIMGLGAQLLAWDPEFVEALADRGFYVIWYDNRDVGLSTWLDDRGVPDVLAGEPAAYLVPDMADDAAGLLDALGIGSAHVFGVSMGGMIAQSLAIRHPAKVRTLTSVMSTTRDEAIEAGVATWRIIGSPGFPFDEDRLREREGEAYDRAFHPEGTARQLMAIVASPDRTPGLVDVDIPTLVIHGDSDPLVDPSGGKATAAAVPGATLWSIPGMGHDLPRQLFDGGEPRAHLVAQPQLDRRPVPLQVAPPHLVARHHDVDRHRVAPLPVVDRQGDAPARPAAGQRHRDEPMAHDVVDHRGLEQRQQPFVDGVVRHRERGVTPRVLAHAANSSALRWTCRAIMTPARAKPRRGRCAHRATPRSGRGGTG
jgi:pimeloyl-ACP methyl ester carboxylesterase